MADIITIYFSMKGQTIAPGMKIVELEKGNTAVAAEAIQKAVGGDLFKLEADRAYSEDHMVLIREAKEELEAGTRVPFKSAPDMERYDTVFLGFPNWWNTMPMVLYTFLESRSWEGKRVIPFCTSEGSGFGNSVRDIKQICRDAEVDEGIAFIGSKVRASEAQITEWAKSKI